MVIDTHGHAQYVSLSICISFHTKVCVMSCCSNFFSTRAMMTHTEKPFMASCVRAWRCDVWCFRAYSSCSGPMTLIARPCHEASLLWDDVLERLHRIHHSSRTCFFEIHCGFSHRHAPRSSTEWYDLLDMKLFLTIENLIDFYQECMSIVACSVDTSLRLWYGTYIPMSSCFTF